MYFKSIKINNFKSIENMSFELKPGTNLLIGDNGVGKTAILEALIVALGAFFSGIKGGKAQGILQSDVRFEKVEVAGASTNIKYFTPVSVESTICINGEEFLCSRSRENETGTSKTKTNARNLSKYVADLANDLSSEMPLFSYHSTARVTQFRREDFGKASKNKLDDRRCGYIGCLDRAKDISSIKDWCLKMEMAEYHKEKLMPEYEAFKDIISLVMYRMSELEEKPKIYYSKTFGDIVYSEDGKEYPVAILSAGYQSVLWMTMDMVFRMALLNPQCEDLSKVHGVVLIDEIDMHLHPKWQWKILDVLKEVFPNIQFIIATHSPIIISSCKDGNLIQIDENQNVNYLPNAYAYSVEDILEFRQQSNSIPKELKYLYNSFEEALNEDDYEMARKILSEMSQRFGDNNTEVKKARMELDVE